MSASKFAQLTKESVSAVSTTPSITIGTRRWDDGKEYVYAYNGQGVASKGLLVAPTASLDYTFTVTCVADGVILGAVANATMATGTYGWIQTRGMVSLSSATVSANTAHFCVGANGVVANCSGTTESVGVLLEAASGSTAVKAYLV